MDTSVSYSVQSFMTCSISVFGAILVVTAVTPTIVVAIALLSIVYYRVQVSTPYLPCSHAQGTKHRWGAVWWVGVHRVEGLLGENMGRHRVGGLVGEMVLGKSQM